MGGVSTLPRRPYLDPERQKSEATNQPTGSVNARAFHTVRWCRAVISSARSSG